VSGVPCQARILDFLTSIKRLDIAISFSSSSEHMKKDWRQVKKHCYITLQCMNIIILGDMSTKHPN